jgi:BMFP domain-containing protein YqiC
MITPPPIFDALKARSQAFFDKNILDNKFLDISPLKDVEKNARTWFDSAFASAMAHFNLVQREEVDNLTLMMEKMAERITQLENKLDNSSADPS